MMESFGTIAELSKNAKNTKKSAGTSNNEILYSCGEVSALGLKNYLKIIRGRYFS